MDDSTSRYQVMHFLYIITASYPVDRYLRRYIMYYPICAFWTSSVFHLNHKELLYTLRLTLKDNPVVRGMIVRVNIAL